MRPAALITGGAQRLGRDIALHLASKGYDIALHYNHSRAEAEATAQDIARHNVTCHLLAADLSDSAQCAPLVAQALAAFPPLSVLVNNAAVFDRGNFLESDETLLRKEFAINFEAPMLLTRAFAKGVKQGAVVNLLDTNIRRSKHSHFYYLLSKKALLAFTEMAAAELAPAIRVNGVAPGYILPSEHWGEEYKEKLEKRLPMGKVATAEEVAQAVYALVASPSLTGQILYVDGGEHLL